MKHEEGSAILELREKPEDKVNARSSQGHLKNAEQSLAMLPCTQSHL